MTANSFIPLQGRWTFADGTATYRGPDANTHRPIGICLSPTRFRSGVIRTKVTINDLQSAGRIVIGYNAANETYYSIGLGGYDRAYLIDQFTPDIGWRAIKAAGTAPQIELGRTYELEISLKGQRASLVVDHVEVIEHYLPDPLDGDQAGLFAWGTRDVLFSNFDVAAGAPSLFVVMRFGEPFNSLYDQVIRPVSQKAGFNAHRADDVFRPGVILQDIIRELVESDVIIAEITPENGNVYYELGYAHALNKPTILLANREIEKLPFDVSGYRVVFYDDTIRGKHEIEETLEKYLVGINRGQMAA